MKPIEVLATYFKIAQESLINAAIVVAATISSNCLDAGRSKCKGSVGPVANLCISALERADDGVAAAEKSLEHAGSIEMASLEKNMTWISLSIAIAPMFGFLGTVWGMIQAFNDIKMALSLIHI